MLRRGQSWCRRWAKRRLWMGVLDSRRWIAVAPDKLDVDGVGGARLESMAVQAAEWRRSALEESEMAKVNVVSAENAIPDWFSDSAVVSILCRKCWYVFVSVGSKWEMNQSIEGICESVVSCDMVKLALCL